MRKLNPLVKATCLRNLAESSTLPFVNLARDGTSYATSAFDPSAIYSKPRVYILCHAPDTIEAELAAIPSPARKKRNTLTAQSEFVAANGELPPEAITWKTARPQLLDHRECFARIGLSDTAIQILVDADDHRRAAGIYADFTQPLLAMCAELA